MQEYIENWICDNKSTQKWITLRYYQQKLVSLRHFPSTWLVYDHDQGLILIKQRKLIKTSTVKNSFEKVFEVTADLVKFTEEILQASSLVQC